MLVFSSLPLAGDWSAVSVIIYSSVCHSVSFLAYSTFNLYSHFLVFVYFLLSWPLFPCLSAVSLSSVLLSVDDSDVVRSVTPFLSFCLCHVSCCILMCWSVAMGQQSHFETLVLNFRHCQNFVAGCLWTDDQRFGHIFVMSVTFCLRQPKVTQCKGIFVLVLKLQSPSLLLP